MKENLLLRSVALGVLVLGSYGVYTITHTSPTGVLAQPVLEMEKPSEEGETALEGTSIVSTTPSMPGVDETTALEAPTPPAPPQVPRTLTDVKPPLPKVEEREEATAPVPKVATPEHGTPYTEIVNPSGFVNTNDVPITIGEYVGEKVILLQVMTYSCINCERTMPYVTEWYDSYKDKGLMVVGIHTPEFAFEKKKENVETAMMEFGVHFPVVLDNDYATWRALGNHFWPHRYLIDIHGRVVYDHIGEGDYKETEEKIQALLAERANYLDR